MNLLIERLSRRTLRALVCWHCMLSTIQFSLSAEVKLFQWEVEYINWSADCLEHVMIGINGQFPGPTIRSKVGDTIVVRLTNKLSTEGVALHWHGIKQYGTPWADGTASISQCPINPGETFEYRFLVDKAGTYFYHGHHGLQRSAGLYGSLIVDLEDGKQEPFHYDGEFSLLLSDLWHKTTAEQEAGLNSIPFRWVGEPQSLLINGRGQFNCYLASHFINNSSLSQCTFSGNEQCAPEILTVLPNKTYRVRIASSTALASLNVAIGNHKMMVVEADANYVQPFEVTDLDIYSGESYSVLVSTNQDPSHNYWISIGVRAREPQTPQSLAILHYHQNHALDLPTSPPPLTPLWNDFNRSKSFSKQIVSLVGSPKPPPNLNRQIWLLCTQNYVSGHLKWAINNISLTLPATPYLGVIKYGLKMALNSINPPENFSRDYDLMNPPANPEAKYGNGVYMLGINTTVDVILQNANMLAKNKSEVHPWHIHGHEFWVLAYGEGRFSPEDDKVFNLNNPPLRNTAVVFPYGWTALRFKADNPGVWPFHCHIEPHFHLGMGVVFAVDVQYVNGIPREALACGLTSRMFDMGGN